MPITPNELQNREFKSKFFGGFDRKQVRECLAEASDEMAKLIGELEQTRREKADHARTIEDYRGREGAIQDTLYSVRGLAEEIKKEARRESDIMVREARLAADRLLQQAREQVSRIEEEISHLRLERDAFEDHVKLAAEEHLRMIEARHREGEAKDRLRFLGRRPVASNSSTSGVATGLPGAQGIGTGSHGNAPGVPPGTPAGALASPASSGSEGGMATPVATGTSSAPGVTQGPDSRS